MAGDKAIFFVDKHHIVCLDPTTGKERWRVERLIDSQEPNPRATMTEFFHGLNEANMHTVVYHRGVLLVVHPKDQPSWSWISPAIIQALSPQTGKELWRHETTPIGCLDLPDLMGVGGLVWVMDRKAKTLVGLDVATGRIEREISIAKALEVGHHHRCYPNRATENYVIIGRRGAEFVDLASGDVQQNHWARGACRYGHMPANGLLYRPPDPCKCYISGKLQGFYALASEKASESFEQCLSEDNPLEKGPAYGAVERGAAIAYATEWPTYRHDPMRSGSLPMAVPSKLAQAWGTDLGGKLSSPVIAGGKVYVCGVDRHEVHALDADSGKPLWRFTAGGRIDSPPTIHGGTVIFGCADGWVYCLQTSDGQLAWRFRAAPGERRVMSHGQLESAWPVPGSVLVTGGVVFCTAGRSSFLDGGMYAYAIDAETGKLLEHKRIHEVQPYVPSSNRLPAESFGALADILLTDGQGVYLRHRKLGFSTPVQLDSTTAPGLPGKRLIIDGGFLDDFWFHRAYWRLGRIQGNLIVFDKHAAFAAAMHQSAGSDNYRFYVPAGGRVDTVARGTGKGVPSWISGAKVQHGGYHLFAAAHQEPPAANGGKRGRAAASKPLRKWHNDRFPMCPLTMVVADKTLLAAGFPDRIDPQDPWATFEGRVGGVLCALSSADGKKLAEYKLGAPPIFNGMAAADGKVYLSLTDGSIVCFGGQ
jgi:outer membrane protein assembly factor BamB